MHTGLCEAQNGNGFKKVRVMARDRFDTVVYVDKDGVAKMFNSAAMTSFFARYPNQRFELSVRKGRSREQNSYYWAVLTQIQDETGTDKDILHEIFRFKFLQVQTGMIDEETGEESIYLKSTTELSKQEFVEYVDKIVRYAAHTLHIIIAPPGEQIEANF